MKMKMKKWLVSLLALVMLLSVFPLGISAASVSVSKIELVTIKPILPDKLNWYLDSFDYTITYSNGYKETLAYSALSSRGLNVSGISYKGKNYTFDNKDFFVAGNQKVTVVCNNVKYNATMYVTSFKECVSTLTTFTDNNYFYINSYEHGRSGVRYFHIKPNETNMYGVYHDVALASNVITIFDENDHVVPCYNEFWNLKKGKEYCLRINYTYYSSSYGKMNLCFKPNPEHAHIYSNACDKSCDVCGATRTTSHSYKKVTTKATLTKDGKIKSVCSKCGYTASKATTIYKASKISLSKTSYTYNGKTQKPSVVVKDSKGKTISSSHYTVTYASGRKNVGTYKVTVKMKGNYSGTKTLTFKVNPVKTTVKATAAKKSLKLTIGKKSTQVTGYEVQYSTSKSFKTYKSKTLTSYKKTSLTLTGLKAKTTYYVRVRTYKTVGGKKYYSGWSTITYKKTK